MAPRGAAGGRGGRAPEVEHRVAAPGPPGFRPRGERARGEGRGRPRRRPFAGRGRRPGTRPARRARAGRRTAPSSRRCPAARRGRRRPRPRAPAGRAAPRRPRARAPASARDRAEVSPSPERSAPATAAGEGNRCVRPSVGRASFVPARSTSRVASVRPASTLTCCPSTARTAHSNASHAPGTRRPGRRRTSGPSSGSGRSAAPIRVGSAARSNIRRAWPVSWSSALAGAPCTRRQQRVPARHRAHAHDRGPGRERDRARVARPRPPARLPGSRAWRETRAGGRGRTAGGTRGGAQSRRGRERRRRPPEPSQRARRAVVGLQERVVEAAQAAEARRERDLGHGQVGLVDQPLREVEAAGLRHGERRGADVGDEEAVEVARADAEPGGERVDRALVERALVDERERAPHDGRGAEPGRGAGRGLGPAAQARPEAGLARRRRGREVAHVRVAGTRRRAHRPAVDAGRGDADEETPVEAGIARAAGAVERGAGRERGRQGLHDRQLTRRRSRRLAVFGHVSRPLPPGARRPGSADRAVGKGEGRLRLRRAGGQAERRPHVGDAQAADLDLHPAQRH